MTCKASQVAVNNMYIDPRVFREADLKSEVKYNL